MDSLRVSGKLKMAFAENAPNYRNFILLYMWLLKWSPIPQSLKWKKPYNEMELQLMNFVQSW